MFENLSKNFVNFCIATVLILCYNPPHKKNIIHLLNIINMAKDNFDRMNVSKAKFMLESKRVSQKHGCGADGRKEMTRRVKVKEQRPLPPKNTSQKIFELAEILGGSFGHKIAQTCSLMNIPEMVNPFLVCFSGHMGAPLFAMEAIRFYAKNHGKLLPFLAIGKGGNKGLFEKVYNRSEGIVIGSEAEAYCNIMSMMAPETYVRKYQQTFNDMDTEGNLRELYRFAKEQGLQEVSYILVTGQPWYDARVLAEWLWMLNRDEFAEIKINLVMVHCPIWLKGHTPDTSVSEISLGYVAASLGPLTKDTIGFDGKTKSDRPERYLMPCAKGVNWSVFKEVFSNYNNMGWPDYSKLLYKTPHDEAVAEVFMAHLFALKSFNANTYDEGVKKDVEYYLHKMSLCSAGYFNGTTEEEFLEWCKKTPNKFFFE